MYTTCSGLIRLDAFFQQKFIHLIRRWQSLRVLLLSSFQPSESVSKFELLDIKLRVKVDQRVANGVPEHVQAEVLPEVYLGKKCFTWNLRRESMEIRGYIS
jgi:hypothetical protein